MTAEKRFNPYREARNFPEFTKEDVDVFYDGFVGSIVSIMACNMY